MHGQLRVPSCTGDTVSLCHLQVTQCRMSCTGDTVSLCHLEMTLCRCVIQRRHCVIVLYAGDTVSLQLVNKETSSVAADNRSYSNVVRGEDENSKGWGICPVHDIH